MRNTQLGFSMHSDSKKFYEPHSCDSAIISSWVISSYSWALVLDSTRAKRTMGTNLNILNYK